MHSSLDSWATSLLANPITKLPAKPEYFQQVKGVLDARVLLPNTHGFTEWKDGQDWYEHWESTGEGYRNEVAKYRAEIEYDRPVYERFPLTGAILDVGGGTGTTREHLPADVRLISIDPFIEAPHRIVSAKKEAYSCLSQPLNFVGAMAEFVPFQAGSFDWVHMRSMLDHVQVPDLALLEAHRVLKPGGQLLVGMYVEGGRKGKPNAKEAAKELVKELLVKVGFERYKDHHTWHPTHANLSKMIQDNGFVIEDTYWQPHWNDRVVYVRARRDDVRARSKATEAKEG